MNEKTAIIDSYGNNLFYYKFLDQSASVLKVSFEFGSLSLLFFSVLLGEFSIKLVKGLNNCKLSAVGGRGALQLWGRSFCIVHNSPLHSPLI